MISEERADDRGTRTLLWALLASILIHAIVLPAAFWSWSRSLVLSTQPRERESVLSSTAVRIERRPVPQREALPVRQPAPAPPKPQAPPEAAVAAPAPPARREIARLQPSAAPQGSRREQGQTLERELAEQQQSFAQEVARLRAQDNPLSIAPVQRRPPAAWRRTYFDVPGHRDRDEVEALLIPLRHWYARSLSCYYVRYKAQFTSGAGEDGVIPWPVCYPANDDAMANPPYPHELPIPIPQRDYVLPPGTYLTALLKSIYDRRP